MSNQTKQEQMYVDLIQLVASVAKDGFGIDVIHNPLFSGTFQRHLERHHDKIVSFILKYCPTPEMVVPEIKKKRRPRTVKSDTFPEKSVDQSKQSEPLTEKILGE